MSEKYKIRDQERLYFVTFSVIQWINVFTRPVYKDLLVESLKILSREQRTEYFRLVYYDQSYTLNHWPKLRK